MLVEKIEEKQIKASLKIRIFRVHFVPTKVEKVLGVKPKTKEYMYMYSLEEGKNVFLSKKSIVKNQYLLNELEEFMLSNQ